MGRNVIEAFAFTLGGLAGGFFPLRVKILMLLEPMIAKTFGLWPNHFTLNLVRISPTQVEPVLAFLRNRQQPTHDIQLFILFDLILRNHSKNEL